MEVPGDTVAPSGNLLSPRALRALTLAALALGLAWRLIRYALGFPIWGDEAMLCLNLLDHGYAALTRELSYGQVAPFLFMWSEKLAVGWLGTSELTLHLLPLLAGVGSMLLCERLARQTLPPLEAMLAVAILAVAIWPVSMCTQAKPYAFDLFWSLVLLLPAAEWLRAPHRTRWLMLLTILVVPALLFSYPAVFVAGGVSLAIVAVLPKQSSRDNLAGFVAYNLAMLTGFAANYWLVIGHHVSGQGNTTGMRMQMYWRDAFPPGSFAPLLKWLLLNHIGELFSCPVGADRGGSLGTLVLFCVGIGSLWKRGARPLLVLLLTPFVLNLVAAVGRFYPYAVPRLSQHLIPSVAVLAAVGAAAVVKAIPSPRYRARCLMAGLALLAAIGIVGLIRDIARPGRDAGVIWVRKEALGILQSVGNGPLVVLHDDNLDPVLHWYLGIRPGGFAWGEQVNWTSLDPAIEKIWTVQYKFNDCFPVLGAPAIDSHWVAEESHRVCRVYDPSTQFLFRCFPSHDEKYEQELQWTLWKRVPDRTVAQRAP